MTLLVLAATSDRYQRDIEAKGREGERERDKKEMVNNFPN